MNIPSRLAIISALLLAVLLAVLLPAPSCSRTGDIPWAAPRGAAEAGIEEELTRLLDAYGSALVGKDRDAFLATIDPAAADFQAAQARFFDRVQQVPFADYRLRLDSVSDSGGQTVAKVSVSYTLENSFSTYTEPERAAFYVARTGDGLRLAGDATEAALGRQRNVHLEDFGRINFLEGGHSLVFFLDGDDAVARTARDRVDQAWPQLTAVLPGVELPKVPVWIYHDQQQIDAVYPGEWQDWVGGASRSYGGASGGEIILDAGTFTEIAAYDPDYNRKMIVHELTHVALFGVSSARAPPFLEEGLADYVAGFEVSPRLANIIAGGGDPVPSLRDLSRPGGFEVLLDDESAWLAYEVADTAVAYLEEKYGNEQVMALLREFRQRELDQLDQDQLVEEVFQSVLGIGWQEFEDGWRRYVLESR